MIADNEEKNNGFKPIQPEQDPKKRQGNYVEDFNDLKIESEQQVPQTSNATKTPEDYIRDIYTPAPKPYFDTESADYKKRAAKLNALGQGLSGVADILSLAQGGQVNAPVRNNKVQGYLADYWNQRQDYTKRLDDWNARDAANKSLANRIALNQWNSDRAHEAQKKWRAIDDERQQRIADAQLVNMHIDNERQKLSDEERARHNRELEKYYKRPSVEKPMRIKTSDGQIHEMSKDEAGYLRSEALSRINALAKAYPYLFEEYNLDDYDYDTGNFKKGYRIAKHTTDEDLIRAYLQLNSKLKDGNSSNKRTGGYY